MHLDQLEILSYVTITHQPETVNSNTCTIYWVIFEDKIFHKLALFNVFEGKIFTNPQEHLAPINFSTTVVDFHNYLALATSYGIHSSQLDKIMPFLYLTFQVQH